MAIDRFYAVIPAYEPDEKMLAVIFKTGKTPDLIDDKTYQNVLNNLRGK